MGAYTLCYLWTPRPTGRWAELLADLGQVCGIERYMKIVAQRPFRRGESVQEFHSGGACVVERAGVDVIPAEYSRGWSLRAWASQSEVGTRICADVEAIVPPEVRGDFLLCEASFYVGPFPLDVDVNCFTGEHVGPQRITQACVVLHGPGNPFEPDRFRRMLAGLPAFVAMRKDVEALVGPCELDVDMSL